MLYAISSLLGKKWQCTSIMSEQVCIGLIVYGKRERCWVPATISRINEDSTFGVTLQVETLVDLIDNHTRLA
jgi:hypothetical protein